MNDPELQLKMAKMSIEEREKFQSSLINKQNSEIRKTKAPAQETSCPNCKAPGNFLWEVNNILRNCIDFCEFPHKCYKNNKNCEFMWKTMRELQ